MTDVTKLLERQSAWQKRRKEWSWAEKIRSAEAIRDSILQLRRAGCSPIPPAAGKQTGAGPR